MEKGFTIIELVIVIIILGILAAFAVPRFIGIATNARIATVLGLEGSMRSAAALAHAQQLADNLAANASVTMEGQTVTMANRYPTADAAGILNALQSTTGFNCPAATPLVCSKDGATSAANCSVSYTEATSSAPPTIASDISNCD